MVHGSVQKVKERFHAVAKLTHQYQIGHTRLLQAAVYSLRCDPERMIGSRTQERLTQPLVAHGRLAISYEEPDELIRNDEQTNLHYVLVPDGLTVHTPWFMAHRPR